MCPEVCRSEGETGKLGRLRRNRDPVRAHRRNDAQRLAAVSPSRRWGLTCRRIDNTLTDSGATYVFALTDAGPVAPRATLTAKDPIMSQGPEPGQHFGWAVDVDNHVLVGAPHDSGSSSSPVPSTGAVYSFEWASIE